MSIGIRGPLALWPLSNIFGVFKLKNKVTSKKELAPKMPNVKPLI